MQIFLAPTFQQQDSHMHDQVFQGLINGELCYIAIWEEMPLSDDINEEFGNFCINLTKDTLSKCKFFSDVLRTFQVCGLCYVNCWLSILILIFCLKNVKCVSPSLSFEQQLLNYLHLKDSSSKMATPGPGQGSGRNQL